MASLFGDGMYGSRHSFRELEIRIELKINDVGVTGEWASEYQSNSN